ncbi:hypothetical protein GOV05_04010 [Candidatus Woesearchaeota archaeon]|nr:hypothetical protein [Candidatus Woesearchaeota archaeon]
MELNQDKFTTSLGKISEEKKLETLEYMKEHPIFLFLPATYEDATNKRVMGRIVKVIKNLQEKNNNPIDLIVLGLDAADTTEEFEEIKEMFSVIPNSMVIWNDSPRMQKLYSDLSRDLNLPLDPGKGRNMWTGLGYRFSAKRSSSFVLHDCDILPEYYDESILISLIAPLVHPEFDNDFSKAYYVRLTKNKNDKFVLRGRVARLLVRPLLDALIRTYADNKIVRDYLEFLNSFKYPLSGEFGMRSNIASDLRVQPDWGLEISTLNNLFQKRYRVAQVDLGVYDHKHSDESPEDSSKGLNRMAEEITKTILRKMYGFVGKQVMDDTKFKQVLYDYQKYASRYVNQFATISANEGWTYNPIRERQRVDVFLEAIKRAYAAFAVNPEEIRPLILWDEVPRDYRRELRKIVEAQNDIK